MNGLGYHSYYQVLNAKDYGIIEKLNEWQKENYEDQFLMNIYNVLKNNTI